MSEMKVPNLKFLNPKDVRMDLSPVHKQRLHDLANFIANEEYEFTMEHFHSEPSCGTAGCIAGHAAVMVPELRSNSYNFPHSCGPDIRKTMGYFTDVNDRVTPFYNLFYARQAETASGRMDLTRVTRNMAVAALRRFADTGYAFFCPDDKDAPLDKE